MNVCHLLQCSIQCAQHEFSLKRKCYAKLPVKIVPPRHFWDSVSPLLVRPIHSVSVQYTVSVVLFLGHTMLTCTECFGVRVTCRVKVGFRLGLEFKVRVHKCTFRLKRPKV